MNDTATARGMDKRTFDKFRNFVYEHSGITLSDNKVALVTARVGKRMRSLDMDSYRDYLRFVMADETGGEVVNLLDAISTNVTSFFREPGHFDFMKDVMADWISQGQRKFRIWSAAASTGEEPYTLAMTLLEIAGSRMDLNMKILATDINTDVLAQCQAGSYRDDKLKTVPRVLKAKYFLKQKDADGKICYTVKQPLKNLMLFRRLNLSRPPFPMKGPMDIIFCRNVMIYFDNTVRRNLLDEMYRLLKPGGYLMVGHAESLTGMVSSFRVVMPSVYVKA